MRYKFVIFLLIAAVITLGCVDKPNVPTDNSDKEKISVEDTHETGPIETGVDTNNETSSGLETSVKDDTPVDENGSTESYGNESTELYGNESDGLQQDESERFLLNIFGINDSKNMLDREIRLVDLVESNTTAVITIDGETFKLLYDVDQEIKDRVVIVTNVDNTTRTAAIAVGYLDSS